MTMVEEMLISPALPVMSMYRLPNGQTIKRGYVANFSQNINSLTKILPRLKVPILIVKRPGQNNTHKDFFVNKTRGEKYLKFMCKYNPIYKGITIDSNKINQLPDMIYL